MQFKPTWNSLKDHITPNWFKEAKFGIYTHWGIYSVPACGPNGSWYGYNMYYKGNSQYDYHKKTYGDPSKFGYKDFIPMFTGEKFDANEWAEMFKNAGAKYAGPVGEHHDGFTMWNTQLSQWNSFNMGPKRDVVGELEKSIRKQGMKYMVALHHAENYNFFPHWLKQYDVSNPDYTGLYGELHNMELTLDSAHGAFDMQSKPSKNFLDLWLAKTIELIDNYSPDMLWFDFGLKFIQEQYKINMLTYYYNKAEELGKDVVLTYKFQDMPPNCAVIDLEQGRFEDLTFHDWITDTTVDNGSGWSYVKDIGYKTPVSLIHYLIDNVSKNGYMLLNVGPKPNGEFPEEAKYILSEMGKWLDMNGEAIYGTTPWRMYGEGPTKMNKSGPFCENQEVSYTGKDIRFTVKGDNLYAICLGWPGDEVIIQTFAKSLYESEIKTVRMLGVEGELPWKLTDKGLKVALKNIRPCKYAYVLKIERKFPF